MADSASRFAALPPRQKATIVVFLLIAIFVVWEVIGMFRGGSSSSGVSPAIAASKPVAPAMTSTPPKAAMSVSAPTPTPAGPAPLSSPPPAPKAMTSLPSALPPKVVAHVSPDQSRPEVEKVLPQTTFLIQQDQIQGKYVAALNELQMLKIEKEIAETSQAIVAANLATKTAEKSITDLLAEAQDVTAPPSSAGKKGAPAATSSTMVSPPPAAPPTDMSTASYSVQSVSMEQDQWHAVLKFKDKLYDVSVGDMLPPDRSTVKAIDQHGVTLDSMGMEQRYPLTVTDNDASSSGESSSSVTAPTPTHTP